MIQLESIPKRMADRHIELSNVAKEFQLNEKVFSYVIPNMDRVNYTMEIAL